MHGEDEDKEDRLSSMLLSDYDMFSDDIDQLVRIYELRNFYQRHTEMDPTTGEPYPLPQFKQRPLWTRLWPTLRRVK